MKSLRHYLRREEKMRRRREERRRRGEKEERIRGEGKRREEELPTNELYFGILRAEGLHGSYLALTEGVDLLNITAELVL